MFKKRNAKVENGNDAVASGLGLAAADQISTGFRAVKIFVFEVQQLIDTHSAGQKSNYHLPVGVFFWLRISVTCSSVKISRSGDLRPSTFRTDARLASTTRQPMAVRYSLLIRVRSFSNIL